MDEMKLKLSTKFMKNLVAKIMTKSIRKKCGCDVQLVLNALDVSIIDGRVHLHVDVDGDISKEEFMKILKQIDKD